ncbi:MAG TPA: hydrogenase maturation protease [Thermoanaerobaculia bacterium]
MSILVAGVGNIFFGDDAFGVEVARRMSARPLPPDVRVVDFGIRGYDLAYALMDRPDLTLLVDAVPFGGAPGTLYTIEPDAGDEALAPAAVEAHALHPANVLRLVKAMGGTPGRVLVIGCEPGAVERDGRMGLSAPVAAAVDEAVSMIESLIARELQG